MMVIDGFGFNIDSSKGAPKAGFKMTLCHLTGMLSLYLTTKVNSGYITRSQITKDFFCFFCPLQSKTSWFIAKEPSQPPS